MDPVGWPVLRSEAWEKKLHISKFIVSGYDASERYEKEWLRVSAAGAAYPLRHSIALWAHMPQL